MHVKVKVPAIEQAGKKVRANKIGVLDPLIGKIRCRGVEDTAYSILFGHSHILTNNQHLTGLRPALFFDRNNI